MIIQSRMIDKIDFHRAMTRKGDKSLILGTSGYIYSYNYAGGYHLANQDYTNCIRTEQGRMLESLFDTTLIGLHC